MVRKYKCKYCNKKIVVKDGMCSTCQSKLALVRTLLLMVKTAAEERERNREKL
jgi:DNA-directed RNA polymerase subunit RPC12/RpoP